MVNRPLTVLAGSIGRSRTGSISRSSASAGTTSASAAHSVRRCEVSRLLRAVRGLYWGYVGILHGLQDLDTDDGCAVRFFMPSMTSIHARSVPRDGEAYKEYRHLQYRVHQG